MKKNLGNGLNTLRRHKKEKHFGRFGVEEPRHAQINLVKIATSTYRSTHRKQILSSPHFHVFSYMPRVSIKPKITRNPVPVAMPVVCLFHKQCMYALNAITSRWPFGDGQRQQRDLS